MMPSRASDAGPDSREHPMDYRDRIADAEEELRIAYREVDRDKRLVFIRRAQIALALATELA